VVDGMAEIEQEANGAGSHLRFWQCSDVSGRQFIADQTDMSERSDPGQAAPWALDQAKMAIYTSKMDISVTDFKQRCLEIIRGVEKTGKPVAITRRGKVVARLQPSADIAGSDSLKPWEQLRAAGGRLLAQPGESVLHDSELEALR